jgi:methyltransferase-like protein/2-polyprenyl-3-methyl-5-hydroxy-6-metoxy-1,4-benzoquinol methylase
MDNNFIYNDVPYPSFTFSQTHPDRLATIAKLHGITSADIENCRVLELGCGDGSNLNWIAHTLPNSKFVGIDLSTKHISDAKANAAEIGITNAEFHAADVMTLSVDTFGKFDYIIAHGLFSWVPGFVRDKILQIYREMLNENGIGYISYNTFPGCHLRDLTRNMMRFHVKDITEPLEQVAESLKFIEFLGENVESGSVYQQIIKQEFSKMADRTRENIFHDDLSEVNQPFYFADFISEAEKNDLQFISEAEFYSSQINQYPQKVQEMFASFGDDIIKTEQYLDFIKSRRFRQTLLCHKNIKVNRQISPDILRQFSVASQVKSVASKPNLKPKIVEKFVTPKNTAFQLDHALTKAALFYLSKIWSKSVKFDDLIAEAVKLLQKENCEVTDDNIETTITILFQLFGAGFIKLHVFEPNFTTKISDSPKVGSFARWQAKGGETVTTLTGLSLSLEDDLVRKLLLLLDGKHDKKSILAELRKDKKLKHINNLPQLYDNNLSQMAKNGLLVA